jgi:hypothetical protein
MFPVSNQDFLLYMASGFFFLGMLTIVVGIIILITRTYGKDTRIIAAQTAKLAQKGISEDVAGLVGNAASLLNALNELVRTAAGVGIFLIVLGILMNVGACWLVIQIR